MDSFWYFLFLRCLTSMFILLNEKGELEHPGYSNRYRQQMRPDHSYIVNHYDGNVTALL